MGKPSDYGFLSASDVAELAGLTVPTVNRAAKDGRLEPAFVISSVNVFRREDIDRWLEARRIVKGQQ